MYGLKFLEHDFSSEYVGPFKVDLISMNKYKNNSCSFIKKTNYFARYVFIQLLWSVLIKLVGHWCSAERCGPWTSCLYEREVLKVVSFFALPLIYTILLILLNFTYCVLIKRKIIIKRKITLYIKIAAKIFNWIKLYFLFWNVHIHAKHKENNLLFDRYLPTKLISCRSGKNVNTEISDTYRGTTVSRPRKQNNVITTLVMLWTKTLIWKYYT